MLNKSHKIIEDVKQNLTMLLTLTGDFNSDIRPTAKGSLRAETQQTRSQIWLLNYEWCSNKALGNETKRANQTRNIAKYIIVALN